MVANAGSGVYSVIVLTSGKEFTARIIERGAVWKVQLPNGSVISLPATKISTVRSSGGGAVQ